MKKQWLCLMAAALAAPALAQEPRRSGEERVVFERKAPAFPFEGSVAVERLNVRMFPKSDQTSVIAAVLGLGEKVTVVGERDDFFQILPPRGAAVWIFGQNVRRDGASGTVMGNDVPVRIDSRVTAEAVCTLKEGDAVKILAEHMGWCRIEAPAAVKYFVGRKYIRSDRPLASAATEPPKATPAPSAAEVGIRTKIRVAEGLLEEQRKLIDDRRLDEVDFSGVVNAYEAALAAAGEGILQAELEPLYKRYRDLHLVWSTLKAEKERKLAEIARAAAAAAEPPKKQWAMMGYVDTTGSTLFKRPGSHKLVMGGKILSFIRAKDDKMIARFNDLYQKYVGVNGTVITNPDGWPGYSVVVVDEIVPIQD